MKRKLMFFMTFLFIGIGLATAQTSKVTGLVTSEEDGQPVVGASVLVNGTTLGTITDIDGKFTISNVPSSSKTLRVSYVGMLPQEVTIKEGILKIVLRSDAKAAGRGGRYRLRYQKKRENTRLCRFYSEK